ncbi:MAG TPA: sigma-70 family RNA polymerase sigma factor [Anaerolineaceae bacterium]|nr:sigma-70 family RNA polymerase sigma factor [Anaerolineaceae bacterium]
MTETELGWLREAIQGNDDAFSQLVETYQQPVYNLCYRMLGSPQEAEDAAQETFWRAYQNLKRYDSQRSFITWLLSIAAHYCIDQQRKRRMNIVSMDILPEEDIPDAAPNPEKAVGQRLEDQRLRMLLNELSEQDRAAVILRYWYDFSDEEIARTLSLTISAVKSRLHRARLHLAQSYESTARNEESMEREKHGTPAF